jgi:hypothetical protein
MTTTADLINRIHSLEKLLQLELASADLMDCLLIEWASNMREMARHNIALERVIWDILNFCDQTGVTLGDLGLKAEAIIACRGLDDASQ